MSKTMFETLNAEDLSTVQGGVGFGVPMAGGAAARFGAKIGAAAASGKMDVNAIVDNGNRWSVPGGLVGGGVGAAIGTPGGPPGIATGAGIGGLAGGAIGWAGGAAYEANRQANQILGQ